jgi:hypothetical protein
MNNCFLKTPLKVAVIDPIKAEVLQLYVFIGNVPKYVKSAINDYHNGAKGQAGILKEFYGPNFAYKLGFNSFDSMRNRLSSSRVSKKDGGKKTESKYPKTPSIRSHRSDRDHSADTWPPWAINGPYRPQGFHRRTNGGLEDDQVALGGASESGRIMVDESDLLLGNIERPQEYSRGPSRGQKRGISITEEVNTEAYYLKGESTITFVYDVQIFPEDKIKEVKEKIFLATNIPFFRQHLFWIQNEVNTTPYILYAQGIYGVDIRDINEANLDIEAANVYSIIGIPIDKFLYELRGEIKVEAYDDLTLIGDIDTSGESLYVVDISTFTGPIKGQLADLLADKYQFDLFYYGFVVKYFPQLTTEAFYDFINFPETEIYQKYPDMARGRQSLMSRVRKEAEIVNENYKILGVQKAPSSVSTAITAMMASVEPSIYTPINLRNLFDSLTVSLCIPEIKAFIDYDKKRYIFRKAYAENMSEISFPATIKTGLIIAISLRREDQDQFHKKKTLMTIETEQRRYMFLNILESGKYRIKTLWAEEDGRSFEDILALMKKFCDPLIDKINSLGRIIFESSVTKLAPLGRLTVKYESLNISIFWKKLLSESAFRNIKSFLNEYIDAGIMSPRQGQKQGIFEFVFHKGMKEFDLGLIDAIFLATESKAIGNLYSYMTNNLVKQRWTKLYGGRNGQVIHRITDVKFDIFNIKEQEFLIFYNYIVAFIINMTCNKEMRQKLAWVERSEADMKKIKKLSKLKESDPELYNLKKYGNKKVYSIKCQNPRQPVIYTEDELDAMSANDRKKLYRFWNFTLNKPAFYGCPSKKYPYLSFIVGVHPKGYCLPCCSKMEPHEDGRESKKSIINKACFSKYSFGKEDFERLRKGLEYKYKHIVAYGKDIEADRLSYLPTRDMKIIFDSDGDLEASYYLYGVPQSIGLIDGVGLLYAIGASLGQTVAELAANWAQEITKRAHLFDLLLSGTLREMFRDKGAFTHALSAIFIERATIVPSEGLRFGRWNDLFIELALEINNIFCIVFLDKDGAMNIKLSEGQLRQMKHIEAQHLANLEQTNSERYLFLVERIEPYSIMYPIFFINNYNFTMKGEIRRKLFKYGDQPVANVYKMATSTAKQAYGLTIDMIKAFCAANDAYKVKMKNINTRNLCYSVIIEGPSGPIYCPVEYEQNIADGISGSFDVFWPNGFTTGALFEFIKAFNKHLERPFIIPTEAIVADSSNAGGSKYEGTLIGIKDNEGRLFYVNEGTIEGLKVKKMAVNPHDVDKAIKEGQAITDRRPTLLGKALYSSYKYELLINEFMNYVSKDKNTKLRQKIYDLITKTNFKKNIEDFQKELRALMARYVTGKAFERDFELIQTILGDLYYSQFDKDKFISALDEKQFEFDRITLNKLSRLPVAELKAELKAILANFVVERPLEGQDGQLSFPNIFFPCEYGGQVDYCVDKKLIIDKGLDEMVAILASDITNPLKMKYIFSGLFNTNTIGFFNFNYRPNERITVIKL